MMKGFAAVVLAAGKGTRLAGGRPSPQPKVLYEIAGQPLINYTLDLLKKVGLKEIVIVVGHQASAVKKIVGPGYKFAFQKKRLGTAHAAAVGLAEVSHQASNILVINGDDSAFFRPETVRQVLNKHIGQGNVITFVTLTVKDPGGLGRVIREGKKVSGIVEEKEASREQKKIKEINDGVYCFRRSWLENNLPKLKKSSVGEYYIVDLINLAIAQGERVGAFKLDDPSEWRGVNTPKELKLADLLMKERLADANKK